VTLDLVGIAEIAKMLGVSTQRVDQLVRTTDFPPPEATISAGRIWLRETVERWARTTGRLRG
jgi:predicted DNA-binding transcriptional regulator AlpA